MTLTLVLLILLALVFDFLNGFNDAANAIATVVSTRVLSPRAAVIWAALFNFIAFLVFGLHVANTMGTGIVDIAVVTQRVIFAALVGACLWDLIAWYFGLPTSSSHALMGGLVGAALVKAGPTAVVWSGIIKTVAFIVVAPVLGFVCWAWALAWRHTACSARLRPRMSTGCSAGASLYRRRCTALATAATMRRKPWAS